MVHVGGKLNDFFILLHTDLDKNGLTGLVWIKLSSSFRSDRLWRSLTAFTSKKANDSLFIKTTNYRCFFY